MKIPVVDIPQSPEEIIFSERIEDLNKLYGKTAVREFRFPETLNVRLVYYRAGEELFFSGIFTGRFEGCCGRCLENYSFQMEKDFDFVLIPQSAKTVKGAELLRREDLGLSFYTTEEIDLAPLISEQVMLALPTRPLCSDRCRGLCGGCGANLNVESCSCADSMDDPRMSIFRTLKFGR